MHSQSMDIEIIHNTQKENKKKLSDISNNKRMAGSHVQDGASIQFGQLIVHRVVHSLARRIRSTRIHSIIYFS